MQGFCHVQKGSTWPFEALLKFPDKGKLFLMAKICLKMTEVQMQDGLTRETASLPQNEIPYVDGKMWYKYIKHLRNKIMHWGQYGLIKHTTHTWIPRLRSLPLHYSRLGSPALHPLAGQVSLWAVELGLKGVGSSRIFKEENSSTLVRAAWFADPNLFFCRENESVIVTCGVWNTGMPVRGLWKLIASTSVYICTHTNITDGHQWLLLWLH